LGAWTLGAWTLGAWHLCGPWVPGGLGGLGCLAPIALALHLSTTSSVLREVIS